MPKKQFAFEKGGSKRLKLSWGAYSKNLKIELDGEYLAGCSPALGFCWTLD